MQKTIYITCPHCDSFLEIEPNSGKVVRVIASDGKHAKDDDKLLSALHKIKEDDATREKRFQISKEEAKNKKSKLDELFEKEKKRIQEEGDITPPEIKPFELD